MRHGRGEHLAAIRQPLPFRRIATLDPCLAQQGVARGAQHLVRALRRQPVPRDLRPAFPAHRRIERRDVEADGMRIDRNRRRPPFALLQHLRSCDARRWASRSPRRIGRRFGLALRPAQAFKLQPLHRPAMRAGHEVPALVAGLELPLDPAQAPDRRGRDHEHLAPVREGRGPRLGQRDRIAFLVGRGRIGVDLVEKDVARRHRPQAGGRVGTGQHQDAAGEFLRQHRVARIARPGRIDPFAQGRTVRDQRIKPPARGAFGHLDRRQHRQHRPRRMVDHKADPVVASLRRADLCGLHERDALRRVARRQRIHDLAQVGRAGRAIPPGFGAGPRRQPAVLVRPFRHRQVRVGPHAPAPGAQDVLGPVKAEVEVVRQIVWSSSSSEGDPEIGEGVELLSDMGFQHPLQDRGLDDHRSCRFVFPPPQPLRPPSAPPPGRARSPRHRVPAAPGGTPALPPVPGRPACPSSSGSPAGVPAPGRPSARCGPSDRTSCRPGRKSRCRRRSTRRC